MPGLTFQPRPALPPADGHPAVSQMGRGVSEMKDALWELSTAAGMADQWRPLYQHLHLYSAVCDCFGAAGGFVVLQNCFTEGPVMTVSPCLMGSVEIAQGRKKVRGAMHEWTLEINITIQLYSLAAG